MTALPISRKVLAGQLTTLLTFVIGFAVVSHWISTGDSALIFGLVSPLMGGLAGWLIREVPRI